MKRAGLFAAAAVLALAVLQEDVRDWKQRPRPPLRKASERATPERTSR
jgi:hypothetical protein